jgi:Fumarase C-terminus
MKPTATEFSMGGMTLGQTQQSLQHLVEAVRIFDPQTSRTEAWSFDAEDKSLHGPVWRIEVDKFPAFILVDDKGNDFFQDLA